MKLSRSVASSRAAGWPLRRARRGVQHSTVKHHPANARSKVRAETMAQLVWTLAPRLPEREGMTQTAEWNPWPSARTMGGHDGALVRSTTTPGLPACRDLGYVRAVTRSPGQGGYQSPRRSFRQCPHRLPPHRMRRGGSFLDLPAVADRQPGRLGKSSCGHVDKFWKQVPFEH